MSGGREGAMGIPEMMESSNREGGKYSRQLLEVPGGRSIGHTNGVGGGLVGALNEVPGFGWGQRSGDYTLTHSSFAGQPWHLLLSMQMNSDN